ncbi:uncharacterized protein LOC118230547 [Anguilla anguilla]|uniref:uncharacterized protein LOC118230547 n=1 Tax=Anguilla anguilla TaxID=7936 RepID=UPI0015AE2FD0|nr:uncharacterized protein LOC118230547 [Anguilla anguilla]
MAPWGGPHLLEDGASAPGRGHHVRHRGKFQPCLVSGYYDDRRTFCRHAAQSSDLPIQPVLRRPPSSQPCSAAEAQGIPSSTTPSRTPDHLLTIPRCPCSQPALVPTALCCPLKNIFLNSLKLLSWSPAFWIPPSPKRNAFTINADDLLSATRRPFRSLIPHRILAYLRQRAPTFLHTATWEPRVTGRLNSQGSFKRNNEEALTAAFPFREQKKRYYHV